MDNKGHSMESCPFRKKIEKNTDRSKDNTRRIEQLMSGDWYTNKDLYDMIQNLTAQLTEFNGKFDKYNGLIEDREEDRKLLEEYIEKVNKIETKEETIEKTSDNWKNWISWIISIILFLLYLIEIFN